MATITRYPFVRHLRSTTTSYIEHRRQGTVSRAGAGASFWFRPLDASISEVPVDDREQEILVRVRTTDLQEVSVPGTITYRFAEPTTAAARVDFAIDLDSGAWLHEPLEAVGAMLYGAASAAVTASVSGRDLIATLRNDPAELAARALAILAGDDRLTSIGVQIVGLRFGVLRPDPDVERALQTPAREQIQQAADAATFERRALAVEREAAIGENELANQIELAKRREQLIGQQGANARREAEDAAAADAVTVRALADRTTSLAEANAASERAIGAAKAESERAHLDAYAGTPRELLFALALRELAGQLPEIGQVVITPDLVSGLVARLSATASA